MGPELALGIPFIRAGVLVIIWPVPQLGILSHKFIKYLN
jgi:hypothetical protein